MMVVMVMRPTRLARLAGSAEAVWEDVSVGSCWVRSIRACRVWLSRLAVVLPVRLLLVVDAAAAAGSDASSPSSSGSTDTADAACACCVA